MSKFIFLPIVLLTVLMLSLNVEAQTKRNYVLEQRNISAFTKLDIDGGFTVHLMQTEAPFLEIEAHERNIDEVETSVKNGRLYISHKKKMKKVKPMTLHIGFQDLEKIDLNGGISLASDAPLVAENLDLYMSDGINIDLEVNAEYLDIEAEGGINIVLCGKAQKADIELIGAGNLSAFCLVADDMDLALEGAGKASVHIIDNLDVYAEGVATVRYKGNPNVRQEADGIVSIRRVDE